MIMLHSGPMWPDNYVCIPSIHPSIHPSITQGHIGYIMFHLGFCTRRPARAKLRQTTIDTLPGTWKEAIAVRSWAAAGRLLRRSWVALVDTSLAALGCLFGSLERQARRSWGSLGSILDAS